jgi:beta-glucosidase
VLLSWFAARRAAPPSPTSSPAPTSPVGRLPTTWGALTDAPVTPGPHRRSHESVEAHGRTVTARLRDSGTRTGREVVQVYLAPAEPGTARPARRPAAFARAARSGT